MGQKTGRSPSPQVQDNLIFPKKDKAGSFRYWSFFLLFPHYQPPMDSLMIQAAIVLLHLPKLAKPE